MRRSYDPHYGSREQLRNSSEQYMIAARERDALKTENAKLLDEITELKALIAYITEGE
jgi:cbb3-type cytochrome oxidase cytochrome c subunit